MGPVAALQNRPRLHPPVCSAVRNWAGQYENQTGIKKAENPWAGMAVSYKVTAGNPLWLQSGRGPIAASPLGLGGAHYRPRPCRLRIRASGSKRMALERAMSIVGKKRERRAS